MLRSAFSAGVQGMVIEAFGAGNVPHLENSLIPVIESAKRRDIPVVIVSQSPRGAVDLGRYEGSSEAARAGAIGAGDMTPEAALAKLMITLGRAEFEDGSSTNPSEPSGRSELRIQAAREAFATSFVGEMS